MTSTDELVKDCIIQELEQVKRKNPDKDGKIELIGKEEIKEQIGRSPDFADAMMMRMIFEVRSYDYVLLGDNEAFF